MASNQFKAALAKAKGTKDLNTFVQGSNSKYLKEGTYDVTIVGVDTSNIANGRISFTLEDGDGKQHTERGFVMSQDGDLSHTVRGLLGATIPNIEALDKFFDELGENDSAFEMLTGMRFRATLDYGKGCKVVSNSNSKYVVTDNGVVISEGEFDNYKDANEEIKARGWKKAYINVQKAEATNGPANISSLEFALAAMKRKREGGTAQVSAFIASV